MTTQRLGLAACLLLRPAALVDPGDKVSFVPVSLREYESLSARAAAGALTITPVGETAGAAA